MIMDAASLREGALFELREYCVLAVYLWICFGALVLFKDSILKAEGLSYLPLGFAAIKAAVLLVLLPYVGFRALGEKLGEGELLRLLLERSRQGGRIEHRAGH